MRWIMRASQYKPGELNEIGTRNTRDLNQPWTPAGVLLTIVISFIETPSELAMTSHSSLGNYSSAAAGHMRKRKDCAR